MAHQVGDRISAQILSHVIKEMGSKEAIEFTCQVEGGIAVQSLVWLSEKAAGMARQQLRTCGFDVDKQSIVELDDNPTLLSGRSIMLEVKEYNGKPQYQIPTTTTPPKARMRELDSMLRDAKKDAPKSATAAEDSEAVAEEDIPF